GPAPAGLGKHDQERDARHQPAQTRHLPHVEGEILDGGAGGREEYGVGEDLGAGVHVPNYNCHPMAGLQQVQIFGVKKSAETRAALRFFAERRVRTHFVDLNERPASPGELRRFAQKLGIMQLVNREPRRYVELGLGVARLSDERWLETLMLEPLLS